MSISDLYAKCMNNPNNLFKYLSKEDVLQVLNINDDLKQKCFQVKNLKLDKKNCEKLFKNFKISKIDFINIYLKNVKPKNYEKEIFNIFDILMKINKNIKDLNHKIYCLQDKRNALLTNNSKNIKQLKPSSYETIILNSLEELYSNKQIYYFEWERILPVKFKNNLRADFFIVDINLNSLVIEYDDLHHSQVSYFNNTELKLQNQKKRDNIKTNYCIKNNIKLLRIPYNTPTYDIKEKIKSFIIN